MAAVYGMFFFYPLGGKILYYRKTSLLEVKTFQEPQTPNSITFGDPQIQMSHGFTNCVFDVEVSLTKLK